MPPDGHIRLLPNHVANKIAAGEVVERPASVLKELLENALDAGATRIDVTVTAGGRTLVSVRDNGCGMNREDALLSLEDALLSLERHATSKIRDVDDIERISTLGFRGEAIPSIASVSRFTLTTRRADAEEGTRVVVNAGTLAEVKTCGTPPGTCIEVRDLFCNVPARRKFLRAFVTEEGHIRATFTVHALAHPDVGFSLTLDGREAYRLPPGATLEERIRALFGAPFAESLVPVTADVGNVHVHGYAERPGHDANLRRDQFVFVNGRPATAAAITYALREAYPRQRAEARPAVVLFIDLPPEQVDVNVHPSKREVRFRRSADVRDALLAAFAPQNESVRTASPETIGVAGPQTIGVAGLSARTCDAGVSPASPPAPFVTPFQPSLPRPAGETPATPTFPEPASPTPIQTATGPWRWFKFLAQTGSGWVLLETDAGLVTLNPRAARERIAYERLIDAHEALAQPLLIPETVTLPPSRAFAISSQSCKPWASPWRSSDATRGRSTRCPPCSPAATYPPCSPRLPPTSQRPAPRAAARAGATSLWRRAWRTPTPAPTSSSRPKRPRSSWRNSRARVCRTSARADAPSWCLPRMPNFCASLPIDARARKEYTIRRLPFGA